MENFFYANNVSFLISNSASIAELVEALKRAPLPYKPPDRHRYKRSGSRFAAAKTPTKKLPSARGRLLEIHKKRSVFHLSGNTQKTFLPALAARGS